MENDYQVLCQHYCESNINFDVMEEKDRKIIIDKIGEIIKDLSSKNIKVKKINDFYCKILDCHDKIKDYPTYQTDSDAELTLKRAKAGWDILLSRYNTLTRLINRKLSIDETEKQFSSKWITFYQELEHQKFEYEKIRLPTIQEDEQEESNAIFVNKNEILASGTKPPTALNNNQNMLSSKLPIQQMYPDSKHPWAR